MHSLAEYIAEESCSLFTAKLRAGTRQPRPLAAAGRWAAGPRYWGAPPAPPGRCPSGACPLLCHCCHQLMLPLPCCCLSGAPAATLWLPSGTLEGTCGAAGVSRLAGGPPGAAACMDNEEERVQCISLAVRRASCSKAESCRGIRAAQTHDKLSEACPCAASVPSQA